LIECREERPGVLVLSFRNEVNVDPARVKSAKFVDEKRLGRFGELMDEQYELHGE